MKSNKVNFNTEVRKVHCQSGDLLKGLLFSN